MKLEYDKEADAIYIHLTDVPYSYGKSLDNERHIDYGENGEVRGIELLCVSMGIKTDGLPHNSIKRLLIDKGFQVIEIQFNRTYHLCNI